MWFGTVGWTKLFCLCVGWRTWHQHLGQPYLSNLDIISTYVFIFLLFSCFDMILMSSILSLAQTFIISDFIMQGFWSITMINPRVMMSLLTAEEKDKRIFILSFEMSLRGMKWNLQCSLSCSSCPLALQSPRNTTRFLLFCFFFSKFRIVWCVRVSIKQ